MGSEIAYNKGLEILGDISYNLMLRVGEGWVLYY